MYCVSITKPSSTQNFYLLTIAFSNLQLERDLPTQESLYAFKNGLLLDVMPLTNRSKNKMWNQLQAELRSAGSLMVFKKKLKTHLFQQHYYH